MLLLVAGLLPSCSIKKMAVKGMADQLSSGPDVFSTDEDPELVRDAVPFGLKTMETLLQTLPEHRGLLLGLCRGFTQYSYAFVQADADAIEATNYARAEEIRVRARKLFVRARDYGLRGLEVDYKGITRQLSMSPDSAAARVGARGVPLLFWTAAAWGSAISLGKDQPELVADLPAVRSMMSRGVQLDEGYEQGAMHEALILLDALPPAMGGSPARARQHFDRAVALSHGTRPGPYVTMASSIDVMTQNRKEFRELLHKALAIDPNREPNARLQTIVTQQKAQALLARESELFLDDEDTSHADSLATEGKH
jgi:predicted anti-sigma-YlaC factor YlaD